MQGRRHHLRPGNSGAWVGLLVALAALPGSLATLPSSSARAESVQTSALTPGDENLREAELPAPLSVEDAERYRLIFAFQQQERWAEADRTIHNLDNPLLLGAVEAQRYLSKRYRASYAELADWLAQHADEPEAREIHALALARHPRGAPAPAHPAAATLPPQGFGDDSDGAAPGQISAAEHREARQLRAEIRRFAAREPRRAELILARAEANHLLTTAERDELRTLISEGYSAEGKVQEAQMLSAASDTPADAAAAHWQAGLAAWRLGRYAEAGTHFQAVARAPGQSSWTVSAAAYWAARVELRSRHPELFNYWLRMAAEYPRTFYGLLAERTLGVDTDVDFENAPFTQADADMLDAMPAGRRALALVQIGETSRAEAELRPLVPHAHAALIGALVAIAERANMPGLSLQLAARASEGDARHHYHALYPVPHWTPLGGFTVDRALLFAVMRQESQFSPHVQSTAGAVGLMQLMPATAHAMAKRTGVSLAKSARHPARDALAEPELNLALAQEYIVSLTEQDYIGNNLVLIAAAYNCGPAAVQHWETTPQLRRDPLLFIESMPSHETRIFTERVLANYWIYRQRLGQPVPDLDALAAGHWPTYTALDSTSEADRRHAENR
jgi:soluble lytic murein transglycosylase